MDWDSSILWGIIGLVGGAIISAIISYIFYFKGIERKKIAWKIDTTCLISNDANKIKGVDIKYNSSSIENLYCSTIQIKNIGNTIINLEDIATNSPLSIHSKGQIMFDKQINSKLLKDYNENNIQLNFESDKSGMCSNVVINFDFLSKKQTITFSLIHTTKKVDFNGVIKGGEVFEEKEAINILNDSSNIKKVVLPCIILSIFIGLIFSLCNLISYQKNTQKLLDNMQYNIDEMEERTNIYEDEIEQLIKLITALKNEALIQETQSN